MSDFKFITYTENKSEKEALEALAIQNGFDYRVSYREGGWFFDIGAIYLKSFQKIMNK